MKKPKKVKRKSTLRERLLRRWRNSSLRVKELSRMEFGKILISNKEAVASMKALDAMAQAAIYGSPLAMAGAQANIYPLGHSCQCSVCYPRLGRRGIGRFFSGLF